MKKLLFSVFMFVAFVLNAQKSDVLYSFDFSDGLPTGWAADSHSSNWFTYNSADAGGEAPELLFYWDPSFDGTTRMVSATYDVSAFSTVILNFKQFVSDYSGGYDIGVATSSDGGSTWNTVWSQTVNGDIDAETKTIVINNSDVGANFQFCFFFNGNSYNINNWNIDDVQLIGVSNLDLAVNSINNETYQAAGDKNIQISVSNMGTTAITSFDANYKIDSNSVVTESVTGVNITTGQSYDYTFSAVWDSIIGNHDVVAWISNINGSTDDNQNNDTITKTFHFATQTTQRTVLYEEFTSSTCSPCATFNTNYFNGTFLDNNEGKYALIKYQMNWPSPGDPYYTEEGGVRRAYYGVSGVPTLMTDAETGTFFNTGDLQNDLDNHYANPAFMDIQANYVIDSPNVVISGTIMPYLDATDFTMQIAIVEGITTGNTGSNGETEFRHVMMKMVPDAYGTSIDLTNGTPYEFNFTQDMTGTNVEEYSDLLVVVFIQNDADRKVFQATNATLKDFIVSFYPADNATDIPVDTSLYINFSDSVRFIDDSEITDDLISNFVSLKDNGDNDVAFTATIDADKQHIVITPDTSLDFSATYTLNFTGSAIEDYQDNALEDSTITFTTEAEPTGIDNFNFAVNVYPVPVTNIANIVCPVNSKIEITDVNGRTIKSLTSNKTLTQIDVSDLDAGLYFVRVEYNGSKKVTKFLKK